MMPLSLESFAELLSPGTKIQKVSGGSRLNIQCPAHEDRTPSLTIWYDVNDKAALNCHAGCREAEIHAAISPQALEYIRSTWPDSSARAVVFPRHTPAAPAVGGTDYSYLTENGGVAYVVRRRAGKKFSQMHPNGDGALAPGRGDADLVPYRLPDVIAANHSGDPIFIVEGEKDADRLAALGLTATTNVGGAGKWTDDLSGWFVGAKQVVVLPDNDEPGRKHAEKVSEALSDLVDKVTVLELPGLPPKGDVSDWIESGGTTSQLLELADRAARPPKPTKSKLPQKPPAGETAGALLSRFIEPPKWAIEGLIPEGLTVLAGKPKVGKSWMIIDLCLAIASGGSALNRWDCEAGDVLLIAFEDSDRRLQDRLRKLGAEKLAAEALDRIHIRTDWPKLDENGLDALDEWLTDNPNTRLVLLDTYQRFRGHSNGSGKQMYAEDYTQSGAIQTLATRHRVAIVIVHHVRQMPAEDWMDTVAGSSGITGAADTIMAVFRDRGAADAILKGTGRDIEDYEHALANKGEGDFIRWQYMGDASIYRDTKERVQILETMLEEGATHANPIKTSILAKILGKSDQNVSKMLGKLEREGKVNKNSYGQWHLPLHISGKVVEVDAGTSTTSTTSTSTYRGTAADLFEAPE